MIWFKCEILIIYSTATLTVKQLMYKNVAMKISQ